MDMTPRHADQQADIHLQIDRLVLHGFEGLDRAAVGDAVARELTRLLTDPAAPDALPGSRRLERIPGGTLTLPAGAGSAEVGTRIARALYGALTR